MAEVEGGGVGFGVEFDAVGAEFFGEFEVAGVGVHEEGDAAAEGFHFGDEGEELGGVFLVEGPAVVAGEGFGGVGDEGALGGADAADVGHEVVEGVAFDVVFSVGIVFKEGGEVVDVVGVDVAFVGAGVDGDAVGAGVEGELGEVNDRGEVEVARVAEGGDFVDVDGEFGGHALPFCERGGLYARAEGTSGRDEKAEMEFGMAAVK